MKPLGRTVHSALLIYALVSLAGTSRSHECSRELSRKVNQFLVDDLFSRMKISPSQLPQDCSINPINNMYASHESSKMEVNRGEWQCNICNKRFISEFYLDRHLQNMHSSNTTENSVCLADFCEVIGCRTNNKKSDYEGYVANKKKFGTLEVCTAADIVVHQQQCQAVAEKCFPSVEERQRFDKLLCKNLKCVNGILKGGLEAFSQDSVILFWVIRLLGCVFLFIVVCFHALVSDNNIYTLVGFKRARLIKKDDYVSNYYSAKSNTTWSRISVVTSNIYKRLRKEIVFMFKYKGKSS